MTHPDIHDAARTSSSPRPPNTPVAACFTREHHDAPQGGREYLLFVPPYRRGKRRLVIMLHGCHQDADAFAQATRMNLYAGKYNACIAYPTQSIHANPGKCWNWYEAAHQKRACGEPAILSDLTRHLAQTLGIEPDRIFIAGFSAGAAMAATMAVLYPELYAALGIHSGVAHGSVRDFLSALIAMQHGTMASYAPHPMHERIPTIVFHGDTDSMVHATHSEQFFGAVAAPPGMPASERWMRETVEAGNGKYGYTRTMRLDARQRIFSEQWMVHGGGHAWYGGDAAASHVDPNGPDASLEMLRFFASRTP
jgi:poly(hydroxyalkanoate) depolymerase family esterase